MISKSAKNIIFSEARSHNSWQNLPIDPKIISELYDLLKFGPTSANCCPARFTFIHSPEAKLRLKTCLPESNHKVLDAPYIVIISYDNEFYEHLPFLFPHDDARCWFEGKPDKIHETTKLNSALQASYLLMSARALGLDCGPVSGFDKNKVDSEFNNNSHNSFMLCALGYGDDRGLYPRSPRFDFNQVCEIL